MSRFTVETIFKAVDLMTRPVVRMQKTVGQFAKNMERAVRSTNDVTSKFSNVIQNTAKNLAMLTVAAGIAATPILAIGANFEQAITDVGAVGLQTRAEIAPLEKLALELGATTKFSATEAAQAMEILSRAGFDVNETLAATPGVLSAAAASGLDMAEVALHVGHVLRGFALDASQAGRVADVLALAEARTNSTMADLGEGLSKVAATARLLKVPFEDVTAAIAMMVDAGLDASVAGSSLNVMFNKMANPTATMTRKMKTFGISFKDAKGDMLPFAKVVEQLNIAAKKSGGNFDKIAFFEKLVGMHGQKAALMLSHLFETGKLKELTVELYNALHVSQKMADLRMDTVIGSWTLLHNAVDNVIIKLFALNAGPLKDMLDGWAKWINANQDVIVSGIQEYIADIRDNFDRIVNVLEKVGKAALVWVVFSSILDGFIAVMTAVNLVMAMNPISLMIIGITIFIGLMVVIIAHIDQFSRRLEGLPRFWRLVLSPVYVLVKAMEYLKELFAAIFDDTKKLSDVTAGGGWTDVRHYFMGESDKEKSAFWGGMKDFGKSKDVGEPGAPNVTIPMATPQERTARSIQENTTTNSADITLRTEKGTSAQVTKGSLGSYLNLLPSGVF
jgi:TP901 family phage tail tape measure protein